MLHSRANHLILVALRVRLERLFAVNSRDECLSRVEHSIDVVLNEVGRRFLLNKATLPGLEHDALIGSPSEPYTYSSLVDLMFRYVKQCSMRSQQRATFARERSMFTSSRLPLGTMACFRNRDVSAYLVLTGGTRVALLPCRGLLFNARLSQVHSPSINATTAL